MPEQAFDSRWPHLHRTETGWAEAKPPEACPKCGRPWPAGAAGHFVVGTHRCPGKGCSHRTHQCEGCRHTHYRPRLTAGCAEEPLPMMAPTGQHTHR